jgi:putative transposase
MEERSTSPHRPPHLFVDGMWYFITASTVKGAHILATDKHFDLWTQALHELTKEFKMKMAAWVALPNHYHLLFLSKSDRGIGSFMKRLNGRTSREFNLLDNTLGRSVWYTYWDTCIRDERGFWTRFNYIHYNPVKHGYVQQPQDWHYSSYRFSCGRKARTGWRIAGRSFHLGPCWKMIGSRNEVRERGLQSAQAAYLCGLKSARSAILK